MAQSSFSKPDLTFGLFVLQLQLRAKGPISFAPHEAANLVRGQFGRMLHESQPDVYRRLFEPLSASPSGLKDPPRPYVLRTRELDGRSFAAGEAIPFRVHVFAGEWPGAEHVVLDLSPPAERVEKVRVEFLTPTELKGGEGLEFGVLFARLRDRISSLRALYGPGPLDIDFRAMGDRAKRVRTVFSDVQDVNRTRISRRTGQRHPISGLIGVVEYEGDLAEFLPYLKAGAWTGVGRQTVWGKGELQIGTACAESPGAIR